MTTPPGLRSLSHLVLNNSNVRQNVAKIFERFRLIRIHQRLQKAVSCLEFFTTHEWNFKNTNVQRLFALLDPNDRQTFYFDVSQLEWRSYIESYIWGTRRFVLKDDPSTMLSAKKQLRRLVDKVCAHLRRVVYN